MTEEVQQMRVTELLRSTANNMHSLLTQTADYIEQIELENYELKQRLKDEESE